MQVMHNALSRELCTATLHQSHLVKSVFPHVSTRQRLVVRVHNRVVLDVRLVTFLTQPFCISHKTRRESPAENNSVVKSQQPV